MCEIHGLELSQAFYEECCASLLERHLADLVPHMALGLVGEGSDCFGFDDSLSRDHDWGPALCLWLPQNTLEEHGEAIEKALALLPASFRGFPTRMKPEARQGRVGPQSIEGFYRRFVRLPHAPTHWKEWRLVPEHFLAVCTNGQVFRDDAGHFTAIRESLLAFYPEDVRRKKIAARCMGMAQTGQYNLPRSLRRGETVAAMLAAARFAEQALSMVYLLNKRYMPFYKWAHRGLSSLHLLGAVTRQQLDLIAGLDWRKGTEVALEAADIVEVLCAAVAQVLREQDLSQTEGNWLLEHGPAVQAGISTPELRQLPTMLE